jgi:Tc toxin complex TcA C-terminal TcB-binding domain/Neuraminidase-like domain
MEQIIFPLQQQDKGSEVQNLQEAFLALSKKLKTPVFQSLLSDPGSRQSFDQEMKEQLFGQVTRQIVYLFQESVMQAVPSGIVDEDTANAINSLLAENQLIPVAPKSYSVQGTVYDAWMQPLSNATIRVYDLQLRTELLLGNTVTGADGKYAVRFTQDTFAATGKTHPDTIVRVYGKDGSLVTASAPAFNASQIQVVDLNLSGKTFSGVSEFENLVSQITPFIGDLSIDQLTETDQEQDISYLSSKVSFSISSIIALVMACRYEKWTRLSAQAFYAMLRQDIPQALPNSSNGDDNLRENFEPLVIQVYNALWGTGIVAMMNAIGESITANTVPYALTSSLDDLQTRLQQLQQSPPLPPGQTGAVSTVYEKISLAGLNASQQQVFITQLADGGQNQNLWDSLSGDPAFRDSAAVDKLQAVFQLSSFTSDNMPLVSALVQKNQITGMGSLAAQAGMNADAWQNFIESNNLQSSLPPNTPIGDYSTSLANLFEQAFPMAAFTARVTQSTGNPNPTAPAPTAGPTNPPNAPKASTQGIPGAAALGAFLNSNPGFDFSNTHVHLFLNQKGAVIPTGADPATLANQLLSLQRIYKIAPGYTAVSALAKDGILSAGQIYAMGKNNFSNAYTGKLGQSQAEDVFEKAALQYGGALTVLGKLGSMVRTPAMGALPDFKEMLKNSLVTRAYPNLKTLFGVSDYCECLDCQSFLGQAAYLTDILEFLHQRISNYPHPPASFQYKVREILLANGHYPAGLPSRRPDLGDIDLDCINTNTELPYIDIVNELLEDYISPPIFAIPKNILKPGDIKPGKISAALLSAITQVPNPGHLAPYNKAIYNILLLSADAIVSEPFNSEETPYTQWIIRDSYITLKITLSISQSRDPVGTNPTTGDHAAVLLATVQEIHETHLSTSQINSNPEYVDTNVYNLLAVPVPANYPESIPFGLPFDLYFNEANAFLDKMGIHAYQLMNVFFKENESVASIELRRFFIACAYLNLSRGEMSLIFFSNGYDSDQKALWGIRIWNQSNTVAGVEVDIFLRYTGLNYEQLVDLLSLVSVNGPVKGLPGASRIVFREDNSSCDTSKMNIPHLLENSYLFTHKPILLPTPPAPPPAELVLTRLDAVNRFLRLWPKTNLSMQELDACLISASIGKRQLDENAAIQLQYFLQLMNQFGLSAMQLLSFYQDIDTNSVDCLYNQLFQNLAISNPLVSQLAIPSLDGSINMDDAVNAPGVMAVIMAACNIAEDGLQFLLTRIKELNSGNAPLTLSNLSYIYRSSVLANQLSLSVADSFTLIDLTSIQPVLLLGPGKSATPGTTASFIEKFEMLQLAGFSVDDLNYALTNQSTASPSLLPDSPTITTGLESIRTALQTVVSATAVVPDPKGALLSQWIADPVLNWDSSIAARLLDILGTADDADYIAKIGSYSRFLQLLCAQYATPENSNYIENLPSISFPDLTISYISYDGTTFNLGYTGAMSDASKNYLLALNTADPVYATAIQSLYLSSQTQPVSTVGLASLPAGVQFPDKNVPLLTYFKGTLGYTGPMSGPVYLSLLAQSTDPNYQYALNQLFVYSQDFAAGAPLSVSLHAMPAMAFPDNNLSALHYDQNNFCLRFQGQMTMADYQYLLTLNRTDTNYTAAIQFLYNNSQSFPISTTLLAALPAGVVLPDSNVPRLTAFKGSLLFSGGMSVADYAALQALSADINYVQAIQNLFISSLPDNQTATPLAGLPAWNFSFPDGQVSTINYSAGSLGFSGTMSPADLQALLAISSDPLYQKAIASLFVLSQTSAAASTPLASLPAWSFVFPDNNILNIAYNSGTFSFTGIMSPADLRALLALNADPNYQAAMINLFANTGANGSFNFKPPVPPATTTAFPDSNILSIRYASGILSFTGVMSAADKLALLGLSAEPAYQSAVNQLYTLSQTSSASTTVNTPMVLPPSWNFSFPDSNLSSIQYVSGKLSFTGPMSDADLQALLALSSDAGYQVAVRTLYANALTGVVPNSTGLTNPPSWVFEFPDDAIANLSYTSGLLSFTGQMSPVDLTALLNLSNDAGYQTAIQTLYAYSQTDPTVNSFAVNLAAIAFPDPGITNISYIRGLLVCNGKMNTGDYNNLLQINTDPVQQNIINFINNSAVGTAATLLDSLPPVSFPATIAGLSYSGGLLSMTGPMTASDLAALLSLSTDPDYQRVVNTLYKNAGLNSAATVNTIALPSLPVMSIPPGITGLAYSNNILSISGAMNPADQATLLGLSNYLDYQQAVNDLYTNSNLAAAATTISFVYPLQTPPLDLSLLAPATAVSYTGGLIQFSPTPLSSANYQAVLSLSNDASYQSAIRALYIGSLTSSPGATIQSSSVPLPAISFPGIYSTQMEYDANSQSLSFSGYMAIEDLDALLSFSPDTYYRRSINDLYEGLVAAMHTAGLGDIQFPSDIVTVLLGLTNGSSPDTLIPERYAWLLNIIQPYYAPLKKSSALQQQLSSLFSLTPAVAGQMLASTNDKIYNELSADGFVSSARNINAAAYPGLFYIYIYIARLSFFAAKFNIPAADMGWLLQNSKQIGAIDFTDVPGNWTAQGGGNNPNESFLSWELLNNCYVFQKNYKPVTIPDPQNNGENISLSVFGIIEEALTIRSGVYPTDPAVPVVIPDPGSFLSGLMALTGWDGPDLYYLLNLSVPVSANPLHLNIDNPVIGSVISLARIDNLLRVQDCIRIASQLQATVQRCASWTMPELIVTSTIADDIKQALKAEYPASTAWMSVIVPVQNSLREKRRDAMLAYLMANPHPLDVFNDEYDVYAKFLIDLEMESCQPTTRIVQAYCTVQLFAQRCLMNLEPNVKAVTEAGDGSVAYDENWSQWQWMRTYELWRRNRRIYLYPENFILPELLPNQSPFFQTMQNDLAQNEVNGGLADTITMNYLESLDGVARLQVQGQWYDDASDTLHVFAGTYGGSPATYYYRTLSRNRVWSPWEQVNLDIPDGHLVPVVISGRIFLFWPVFTSTTDEDSNEQHVPEKEDGKYPAQKPPEKYWSIQMAYSEYQDGSWSPKKISSDSIQSMVITYDERKNAYPDKPDFAFIAWNIPKFNKHEDPMVNLKNSISQGNQVVIGCYYAHHPYFNDDLYISSFFISEVEVVSKSGSYSYREFEPIVGYVWVPYYYGPKVNSTITNTDNHLTGIDGAVKSITLRNSTSIANKTADYGPLGKDGPITVITTDMTVLTDTSAANAFKLNTCRGFPEARVLLNPVKVPGTRLFEGSQIINMLDTGTTPLSVSGKGKILNPPDAENYRNSLAFQMSVFDQYLYLKSNGKEYPFGTLLPFFYQDGSRTYYVAQEILTGKENFYSDLKQAFLDDPGGFPAIFAEDYLKSSDGLAGPEYHFYNFYHPYACRFIQLLFNHGTDALINRNVQLTGDAIIGSGDNGFDFNKVYDPGGYVYKGTPVTYWNGKTDHKPAYPKEDVDFDLDAGYGLYNWEFFFFGVLMTAMNLSQNQQFEEADHWFKYIFNPGDTSHYPSPQKYWVTKPFFAFASDHTTMDQLITQLDLGEAPPDFVQSVTAMREDPFDPFAIAQARTLPYMITTVMKYLDNLIAWGDSLFRKHTMESVNLALQIYLLAWEFMEAKPEAIPNPEKVPVNNYYQLESALNSAIANNATDPDNPWPSLSDPLVQIENMIPVMKAPTKILTSNQPMPSLPSLLYFCIPPNEQLLQYWDIIADRLYKIRHCENIEGQFDPLSPFPGGAGAGNQDPDNLNDLNGMQLYYRFNVMIQKATVLCTEVKALGAALLSALEKKDAEALSLLHAGQEITVQNAVMQVKQLQVTDAQYGLDNLNNYQVLVQAKIDYYQGLINDGLNTWESISIVLKTASSAMDAAIALGYSLAGGLFLIPNFAAGVAGFGGSATATAQEGGQNSGDSAGNAVKTLSALAAGLEKSSALAGMMGGFQRRSDEWQYQLQLASDEMAQVKSQISSASTRLDIANQEVQNQQMLIDQANDTNQFLLNKYTNQQLYSWMITQISNVYFTSYQLTYSTAKRTETCFQFELGLSESSYIHYGYWNSLKSGLLSGELMMNDLRQMEMDYLKLNAREFELTKNISLAQFDPVALLQLKKTGSCFLNFPEELFDMDYPGHYFRRIRSVSITIPCVAGPYTTVSCTLTITTNSIRISNDASGKYPRKTKASGQPADDSRFGDNAGITISIATSSGLNDSGLFELNFHDERYLPFEFSGAISSWYMQMPQQFQQFDFDSISDVIVQLKYTSRDGGAALQSAAQENLQNRISASLTTPGLGLFRVFSAKRDFPTQWYKFLNSANTNGNQELDIDITDRFPYFTKNPSLSVRINRLDLLADSTLNSIQLGVEDADQHSFLSSLNPGNTQQFGKLLYGSQVFGMNKPGPGPWEIIYSAANNPPALSNDLINDLILIFYYNLQKTNG